MSEQSSPRRTVAEHLASVVEGVLASHRPLAAEVAAKAVASQRNGFLEGLEQYNANLIGPFLDELRSQPNFPDELRQALDELAEPGHQFTGIIGSFFVYGVMFSLASTLLQPFLQATTNDVWSANPDRPLSPADLANMVVQGYLDAGSASTIAAQSGLATDYFNLMVSVTGMPPSPQDLFEMFRRGIIPMGESASDFPSVYAGLAQGHTKDEWISYFQNLAHVRPSVADFVNAAIREQIPYPVAAAWAQSVGLDFDAALLSPPPVDAVSGELGPGQTSTFFDMLVDIGGRPPSPGEAARMAYRGIIPWTGEGAAATTFQQAIAESDLKTKWTDQLQALSVYLPPPGEVSTLYRHGFIDTATAEDLWGKNGVPAEYFPWLESLAIIEQTAQERILAKGEVLALYIDGVLTEDEALQELTPLGYTGQVAAWLIQYATFQRIQRQLDRTLETISRQYIAGTVSLDDAQTALANFGLPDAQVTALLADWQIAKQLQVPVITAAQIASAVYYEVETIDDGMQDLLALGYSEYNAWRIISLRLHGPQKIDGAIPSRPAGPQI